MMMGMTENLVVRNCVVKKYQYKIECCFFVISKLMLKIAFVTCCDARGYEVGCKRVSFAL